MLPLSYSMLEALAFRSALPSLCRVWVVLSGCVLVAKAAGMQYDDDDSGKKVSHRAIMRHAVLVHDGRYLKRACVVVLFASMSVRRRLRTSEYVMDTACSSGGNRAGNTGYIRQFRYSCQHESGGVRVHQCALRGFGTSEEWRR